jgi:hypothetical protein
MGNRTWQAYRKKLTTPSQDLADLQVVGTVPEMLFGGV